MNGLCGICAAFKMDVLHKYYIVKLSNIMNDKKLAIRVETSAPYPNRHPGPRH